MRPGIIFEDYIREPEYTYNLFALVYVLENYFSASDDSTLLRYREEDGIIYPEFSPNTISDSFKEKKSIYIMLDGRVLGFCDGV